MDSREQIVEYAKTLNTVNYEIAELKTIKEEIEKRLCALLEHGEDGSKTYTCDKYKVTITTGYEWSLDIDEYEIIRSHIPECFNPVRKKISYKIDKQIVKDAEKYASRDEINLLGTIITKTPKKLHIKITAGA